MCQGVSIVMWAINKAMKLVDRVEVLELAVVVPKTRFCLGRGVWTIS